MVDCSSALERLQGCTMFSGIDVKAAFQNVVVPQELQRYLGIVT